MRKIFRLAQCFLFCAALLISGKSFAAPCTNTENPSGCSISTSDINYTISGNLTGTSGFYFEPSADRNSLTLRGNIITLQSNGAGVDLESADSNIINITGNISTSESMSDGIRIRWSSNNNTTINGNISTEGGQSRGIYLANSSRNTTILYGNIISAKDIGLFLADSSENFTTINGNISTIENSDIAVFLEDSSDNNTTINGNISTLGNNAHGIYLKNSGSNTVNMTGNISTTGDAAYGIYLLNETGTNNTNTVNMTGNILTSRIGATGINLLNDDLSTSNTNTVHMTGNIRTTNSSASGISLSNDNDGSDNNNTVNMTGNIETNGGIAYGISLYNDSENSSNTVNMRGNILTTGDEAHGIDLNNYGTNNTNTVHMTGNIETRGADAAGIRLFNGSDLSGNNTSTVNMTGRISVTGANSYAIFAASYNSSDTNTIQLNKGSSVIGRIVGSEDEGYYTANNFLKLNLGAGASYSFATTGFTVQDLNGRPMVTGSAHAAGVGNITTASQSLYERTSQITQSLDDRVRTYDAKQNTSQDFWVNTYYSDSNRGGQGLSGSNLSFNQYRSGITAGFNVKNTYTPTELIVNFDHDKLNIDEGNQGISSNTVMAGALFPDIKKLFTGTISAKAMVGYSDFSGDRKVLTNDVAFNGSRNVTANYQSSHLTIGSAWTKTLYQTDKMILDTLVGIDLNTQHINSYSESDLFKWNSRTINQLQERVTLGMEIKPLVKPLTLFGRVGIERRDLISGENQNYAINNTAVSYNDSNQRNTYATLNAGAYYPLTPTVKAYAQVRYYDSVKDIDSLSGSVGISGQF